MRGEGQGDGSAGGQRRVPGAGAGHQGGAVIESEDAGCCILGRREDFPPLLATSRNQGDAAVAAEKPGDKRPRAPSPGVPPPNKPPASAPDPGRPSVAAPRSTRPSIRPPDAPGDRGEDAPNAPPRSKSVNLESELGEASPYTSGKFQRVTEELLNPSGESIEQTEEAGATGGFVPLPRHADGVDYDEELDFLIRVAAQAGLPRGVPNAINYTTLLIGFALCSDRASRWLQRLRPDKFRRDELLASRKLTREGARIVSRARQLLLPADRSPYSPSATLVLQRAGEVAALVASRSDGASADRRIGTRHLLAAFLFRNPGEHEADLLQWLNSTDVRLDRK